MKIKTPETDAAKFHPMNDKHFAEVVPVELSEKLELELKEARLERDLQCSLKQNLIGQVERLRKVCDALSQGVSGLSFGGYSCCRDGRHSIHRRGCLAAKHLLSAVADYNQLPHVKK